MTKLNAAGSALVYSTYLGGSTRLGPLGRVGSEQPPPDGLAQGLGHHQVQVEHGPRGQPALGKQVGVQGRSRGRKPLDQVRSGAPGR